MNTVDFMGFTKNTQVSEIHLNTFIHIILENIYRQGFVIDAQVIIFLMNMVTVF